MQFIHIDGFYLDEEAADEYTNPAVPRGSRSRFLFAPLYPEYMLAGYIDVSKDRMSLVIGYYSLKLLK